MARSSHIPSHKWVIIDCGNKFCLFNTKPIPELMLTYQQSCSWTQTIMKFDSYISFRYTQICRHHNVSHFIQASRCWMLNATCRWLLQGMYPIVSYRMMYVLEWWTVFAFTRGLFWFAQLRINEGNKHQNNTLMSGETVRYENTYIIFFLTQHNKSTNDNENDYLYTSSPRLTCSVFVLLMMSQPIVDDVTMARQLWRNHMISDI